MKINCKKDYIFIIAENIKWIRNKNNLTLDEMAKILETSTYSLKKLERGILPKRLGADILFKIQSYFNIPAQDIVDRILKD